MSRKKDEKKQVLPLPSRPVPLKDRTQAELIEERRKKRNERLKRVLRKE